MRLTLARFARSTAGRVGVGVLVLMGLFVGLVPVLSSSDPDTINFALRNQGPSAAHPLGTDYFGRDLLVRLALGGRLSLEISLAALGIVLAVGFLYGAVAGMAPRRVDDALMRLVDSALAIPRFPMMVIILVIAGLRTNAGTLVLALAVGGWMIPARLVRMELVTLRQRHFVTAARAVGVGPFRLVFRHFLPNALGVLLIGAFLELPALVLLEAFASALGLGINPPTPTWGNLAYDGLDYRDTWEVFIASVAIAVFSIAANFAADGLQEALEPRRGAFAPRRWTVRRLVARLGRA